VVSELRVPDRFLVELGKTSGLDGTDPRCREGAVPCDENETRHSKIRSLISCVTDWPEQPEVQRKGWTYCIILMFILIGSLIVGSSELNHCVSHVAQLHVIVSYEYLFILCHFC